MFCEICRAAEYPKRKHDAGEMCRWRFQNRVDYDYINRGNEKGAAVAE
jgi:hypothetical protein